MLDFNIVKAWKGFVTWRNFRAFLCTLAVSLSFNCTWRTPREGFRYGGLQFFIALTVANVFVALPASFLHLALGQLIQEDVVGVWRAVPFFKGIGYLRLLVSYIGSIYTTVYLTIVICYFLEIATTQGILFPGCTNSTSYDENANVTEMLGCLKETFIEPEGAQQHLVAILIIIFIVTIVFTVIFYWFTKIMKCILYVLGPVIIIMCIIIAFGIGDRKGLDTFNIESNWRKLFESDIWHSALNQALLSTQLSGGYLILSGASLYPHSDTRWTALFIVGTNIITSLAGLVFWFGISGENKDTSAYAVLIQAYYTAEENGYDNSYPMFISSMLILSGAISMLTFLYPLYDFMRRIVQKWQFFSTLSAYIGVWIALSLTQFGLQGLTTLEYTVVPFLINFGLACEIFALIVFYGLKPLIRDFEFLIGQKLLCYWPFGWWITFVFIITINTWWVAEVHLWLESRWEAGGLIGAAILSNTIFFVVATISVNRQVELNIFEKFKSSFRSSRHWGPRNLLTNLYWKTYCQAVDRIKSKSGSGLPSFRRSSLSVIPEVTPEEEEVKVEINVTGRSNSDGVLYNGYRKAYISNQLNNEMNVKKRSMSLDMNVVRDVDLIRSFKEMAAETRSYVTPDESIVYVEKNISVVAVIETQE